MAKNKELKLLFMGKLKEYFREPTALLGILIFPIIWMLLLGLAFSGKEDSTYSVAYISQSPITKVDQNQVDQIKDQWLSKDNIKIKKFFGVDQKDEAFELYGNQRVLMVIESTGQNSIDLYYNKQNDLARAAALTIEVNDLKSKHAGPTMTIKHVNRFVAGERYIEFLTPGILAFSIFSTCLFGMSMSIVANRRDGLFERFAVTPMRPINYFYALFGGRAVILLLEVFLICTFAYFVFSFNLFKYLGSILGFSLIGTMCFSAIAISMAARSADTSWVGTLTKLITIPSLLLSGAFFSTAVFPEIVQDIIRFLPMTAFVDGLRVLSFGGNWVDIYLQVVILLVITIALTVYSLRKFKWSA